MNSFAHAIQFLDEPWFAVGCCLPDLTRIVNRKCRVREKTARLFVNDSDPAVAAMAKGIVQHHRDDDWFHRTPIFNELSLAFAVELRSVFDNERGMRLGFVGHVLTELLLDAWLHQRYPDQLDRFYDQFESVDFELVQSAVNQMATVPTDTMSKFLKRFVQMRFLFDYSTDAGAIFRMNQILGRVGLEPLGDSIFKWLPSARQRVYRHGSELLSGLQLP